jgi:hypothetical protein
MPIPVAARSRAWVFGRSAAEIVGPNPTRGMDVCVEKQCVKRVKITRSNRWAKPEANIHLVKIKPEKNGWLVSIRLGAIVERGGEGGGGACWNAGRM